MEKKDNKKTKILLLSVIIVGLIIGIFCIVNETNYKKITNIQEFNYNYSGGWAVNDNVNYESGVAYPSDSKYYNLYTTSTNYTSAGLQHGMEETSGWYGDSAKFVHASNPWVHRGDNYSNSSNAGVFNFRNVNFGNANTNSGSRSAVVIN